MPSWTMLLAGGVGIGFAGAVGAWLGLWVATVIAGALAGEGRAS